ASRTVYAQWRAIPAVTFNLNYTGAPAAQAISLGQETTLGDNMPANPTRAGFVFTGWFSAASAGTAFTGSTAVTASRTVYAQWRAIPNVTFSLNYTGAPAAQVISLGQETTLGDNMPAYPARAGFYFTGWDTRATGAGTAFTANTTVTANITVYARWAAGIQPFAADASLAVEEGFKLEEEQPHETPIIDTDTVPTETNQDSFPAGISEYTFPAEAYQSPLAAEAEYYQNAPQIVLPYPSGGTTVITLGGSNTASPQSESASVPAAEVSLAQEAAEAQLMPVGLGGDDSKAAAILIALSALFAALFIAFAVIMINHGSKPARSSASARSSKKKGASKR
ncbi:MAG: InlB B-repeat-containing protein, partial [Coriobacteriia bacterium]|nr:InlB B-repeat-containing protein [Coriobacteriia bacterium]